ncbi:RHO1 GDP-GTP exchange protein 2 [Nakaseomyces bracarensis]|uniref:RHO1 GDP-GTP exchange protein 2 n=1 Tax=Nakaseomyces bracarensis TaxID=273131 RepID=A0ABR4NVG7_9SACH
MVDNLSLQQRHAMFADIFGVERRDVGSIETSLPSKVEDIAGLDSYLVREEDETIGSGEGKSIGSQYMIMSQETKIKDVPDTQSLSSADNTPMNSPQRPSVHRVTSPVIQQHIMPTPFSPPAMRHAQTQQNISLDPASGGPTVSGGTVDDTQGYGITPVMHHARSSPHLYGQKQHTGQRQHEKVRAANYKEKEKETRRQPSLPQLALAGLKKQASFSNLSGNQNVVTPTHSQKSPLQAFHLFSRSSSRDLNNEQSQNGSSNTNNNNRNDSNGSGHNNNNNNNNSNNSNGNSNGNNGASRSMSLNSSTFKNLANSFQNRKISSGSNHNNNHNNGSNMAQRNDSVHSSHSTQNSLESHSTIGLGLKTRVSSTSLTSKRFHSASSTSLHSNYHHHHMYNGSSSATTLNNSGSISGRRNSSISSPQSRPILSASTKRPQVYPALLSRVASKFRQTIQLGEYKKDGLLYRDAFTGQQAVDVICALVRTSDRNLALLLGRSLDAQKLFHDVVYEHRLRDSPYEVYEFTDNSRYLGKSAHDTPSTTANNSLVGISHSNTRTTLPYSISEIASSESTTSLNSAYMGHSALQATSRPHAVPTASNSINGVFTLLAECYSPTCTRNALCYSISCPRRLEQQARLNLKPNGGLKRNISMALDDDEEEKPSWTSSVSKEEWENLPKKEIKRQEAIYEVYISEKKFVKSLEVTRDTFMKTLSETNIIPADIRKNFVKHVFAHINDIYSVNRRFLEALQDRQKSSPVVRGIGDILLRFIPFFEPFVQYVASRPYAKYLIETQRSVNPYFARFDDDMMNSSLRHGIDSFLSQGVSRPGRYMLLVREIMKSSEGDENIKEDYENLSKAMEALKNFMKRIDKASGAAQDRHDVKLLKQKILFKNEYVNLGLNSEKRKIKHEGALSRKELTKSDGTTAGDIQFYLLDNMLLFLKAKAVNKWHQHKVFQRPIPLPLLFVSPSEDMPSLRRYIGDNPGCSGTVLQSDYNVNNPKNAMTFLYYGAKQRYQVTLYAAQYAGLQTLLDKVKAEQQRIIDETEMINITKISDRFFDYMNKINSVSTCDGGRKLLIATNLGLYMSNIKRQQDKETQKTFTFFSTPVQLVHRNNITQVAVLEEFKSILLLIDKKLYSCPLALIQNESNGTSYFKKHSKELINHVNFFAEGDCNGKRLVVTAHSSSHSIKFFEHEHPLLGEEGHSKKTSKKKITEVTFDSEPVSISFLKANLCIGCKKGFQIVSISQNAHESLLDPADTSLEFALKDTLKPMAIYRVGNMFLLCYTEFAFFVNTQGWRKKESHIIHWESEPQKFAIWYPYILAFDSNFIEIRKIDTGELVRCILGEKIRLLQTNTQEILYAYEDSRGYDTVASLDFWG